MLEESVSNHGHERVAVEALPRSSLEVVETQFFFQLLVSLLANPSRFEGGRQGAQVRLRRQVGEIFFSPDILCSLMSQTSSPGRCC